MGYNVGNFNAHGSGTKYARLNEQMNKYDADIACITETGLAWQNVEIQHRLPEVIKHWWKNRRVFSAWNKGYFKKTDTTTRLPGGVSIILRNEVAGRIHSSGRDPTGLGRWVWVRLRGYDNRMITVVSAYRPCYNITDDNSTYAQHLHYNDMKRPRPILTCPRDNILTDLEVDLAKFHEQGDQIHLTMDTNEKDLYKIDNKIERILQPLSMKEVILHQHPRLDAPPTHNRGSRPIDGTFTTPLMHEHPCGYLRFEDGIGDHRPIWQDITKTEIFGLPSRQPFVPPHARRLQCRDPRTMKKYQEVYWAFVQKHKLFERACNLEAGYSVPLTDAQAREWVDINNLRFAGMLQAEKKCRTLKFGLLEWSPTFQDALMKHRFFDLLFKRRLGRKIGYRYVRRLAK